MNIRVNIQHPTNSGRRVGWHKHLKSVDVTKTNGYAFEGDFIREGLNDLPLGAVIIRQSPTGSVANGGKDGAVLVVREDGLHEVLGDTDWSTKFLLIRDAAVSALGSAQQAQGPLSDVTDAELIAEVKRRGLEVKI